jgi:hypothetical protein
MDLFRFEGSSGVFMRGIRTPHENLSENFDESNPALQRWAYGVLCGESQRDERNVLPSLKGHAFDCLPNPALKRLGYCRTRSQELETLVKAFNRRAITLVEPDEAAQLARDAAQLG